MEVRQGRLDRVEIGLETVMTDCELLEEMQDESLDWAADE